MEIYPVNMDFHPGFVLRQSAQRHISFGHGEALKIIQRMQEPKIARIYEQGWKATRTYQKQIDKKPNIDLETYHRAHAKYTNSQAQLRKLGLPTIQVTDLRSEVSAKKTKSSV